MKVQLIEEDLEGNFHDVNDCPLARALKRLGYKDVSVGGFTVDFDGHEMVKILNYSQLGPETKKPLVMELDIDL